MLDAFKIKPFDLEPVFSSWTPGPRFLGDPKKDPPVDDWLQTIKSGCIERNVPKEYWHTCAQHFMGDKAKGRLSELKKVMAQVHGGNYRWNWKKFKVAMKNMSWDIDTSETETVKIPLWWMPKSFKTDPKSEEESKPIIFDEPSPILSRSNTITRLFSKDPPSESGALAVIEERPPVGRAASSFWPVRKNSTDITVSDATVQRPVPRKAKSDGSVLSSSHSSKTLPPLPGDGDYCHHTRDADLILTTGVSTVRAPAWLLNATTALDFLANEHPRVMSTLSAILIVAGTIPALPAIGAGAGGAVLASSTAHAVGAIAVGLGSWIKTQQEIHAAK
ncbi:hypothetical protein DFH09DRAFT_1067894 [Mycena vulgaris]|nr:hypothetical protein DFH09DRAFT_1067894 [Mycena vulgaris]